MSKTYPNQGNLLAKPIIEALQDSEGVPRLEDLFSHAYEPEAPATLPNYAAQIGAWMAVDSRKSFGFTDEPLKVYGNDFERVEPKALEQAIFYPYSSGAKRRTAPGVVIGWQRTMTIDRQEYPGVVSHNSGVAVDEELYGLLTGSPEVMVNRIMNQTIKARRKAGSKNPEEDWDVGAESAMYVLFDKLELARDADAKLLGEREVLERVEKSVTAGKNTPKRQRNLEEYRLEAETIIQNMIRVACRAQKYGKTETEAAQRAASSNLHRSGREAEWFADYTSLAIRHNDAARGKINGLVNDMIRLVDTHSGSLIRMIDREYED